MQPRRCVIDLPLTAFIPESYIGDLNLRLVAVPAHGRRRRRPRAHAGRDVAADLERELSDRFGAPPTPVRNLLYIVRLRALARRAGVASIAREDGAGGQPVLSVRALDTPDNGRRDFREALAASRRRDFERGGVVTVGHAQIRIDLGAAGTGWRDMMVEVLEAAAGAVAA